MQGAEWRGSRLTERGEECLRVLIALVLLAALVLVMPGVALRISQLSGV